jgi:hypothetical protein
VKLGAGKPTLRKTVFRDVGINGTPKRYKQPDDKQYDNQDDVPFHK